MFLCVCVCVYIYIGAPVHNRNDDIVYEDKDAEKSHFIPPAYRAYSHGVLWWRAQVFVFYPFFLFFALSCLCIRLSVFVLFLCVYLFLFFFGSHAYCAGVRS